MWIRRGWAFGEIALPSKLNPGQQAAPGNAGASFFLVLFRAGEETFLILLDDSRASAIKMSRPVINAYVASLKETPKTNNGRLTRNQLQDCHSLLLSEEVMLVKVPKSRNHTMRL